MNRALLVASAGVIFALPAFAQTPSSQTPPPQNAPAPPQNAPAQAAPAPTAMSGSPLTAPSTADFVKQAAISGTFEIQSSELALRKHIGADKSFAERMIHDHERLGAELKRVVRADHIEATVPTGLDRAHQKMLDRLRGESGRQFDQDYDRMQQQGHEEAVSMFQSYAQGGDDAALKAWAGKTLPDLQNHLAMAQKLS